MLARAFRPSRHIRLNLILLVAVLALRTLLPWQADLPHHPATLAATNAQATPHDCGHEAAEAASPAAVSDETGTCQIRCDLATALAVVPAPALMLPELPEIRTATQPVLTLGLTAAPDHPPPIA